MQTHSTTVSSPTSLADTPVALEPSARVGRHGVSTFAWVTLPSFLTIAGVAVALQFGITMTLLPIAVLFGWTQIGGLCGCAHVNTMMFYRNLHQTLWLKGVIAYSLSGLLSSILMALTLSTVGSAFSADKVTAWLLPPMAILLAIREMGWWEFPLPERKCQTERTWAHAFGWISASAMWGFHIGVGFSTVITYGGFWALALLCAGSGPLLGGALLSCYWLGRIIPLWLLPAPPNGALTHNSADYYSVFRSVQALGLAWCSVVGIVLILQR